MKKFFTVCLLLASSALAQNINIFEVTPGVYEGQTDILLILNAADNGCKNKFYSSEIIQKNLGLNHKITRLEITPKFGGREIKITFDTYVSANGIETNTGPRGICHPPYVVHSGANPSASGSASR